MSSNPAIEESYVVDGRRIEALRIDARRSNVPTIVMLHEGLRFIARWKDFPSLRVLGPSASGPRR